MDGIRFDEISRELTAHATVEQCLELVEGLQRKLREAVVEALTAVRSKTIVDKRSCPHCGEVNVHRHGRDRSGRPRFKCVGEAGCGRTFGVLLGTVFHRMRKPEVWLAYTDRLLDGVSLNRIVEDDIGISRHTAWRWRHRLLPALSINPPPTLSGIIEVDETYFPTSYKGHRGWQNGNPPEDRPPRYRGSGALKRGLSGEQVPILTAVDRNKNHIDHVLRRRTTKAVLEVLTKAMEKESVICSDAFPGYRQLAEATQSQHHVFEFERPTPEEKAEGLPRGRQGALGLGRVNSWHEIMDTRFNRIHKGVSTRYLPHYLTLIQGMHAERLKSKAAMERAMTAPLASGHRKNPPPKSN